MCVLSGSVLSDSSLPSRLQPARLLCPWDVPNKNTGVGCNFFLQGIAKHNLQNKFSVILWGGENSFPKAGFKGPFYIEVAGVSDITYTRPLTLCTQVFYSWKGLCAAFAKHCGLTCLRKRGMSKVKDRQKICLTTCQRVHHLRQVVVSRSAMSNPLRPHGLQPTRLLCPWDSPGKNTGMGCHACLQGIFSTQESEPGLLHYRQTLYCLSHQGSLVKDQARNAGFIEELFKCPLSRRRRCSSCIARSLDSPKEVTLMLSLRGYPRVLLVRMKSGSEFQTEKGHSRRHGMVNILLIFILVFNPPVSIT